MVRSIFRLASILLAGLILAFPVAFSASAADFDLKDTDGHAQRLADMKGKWVVVNFWATWCAPCVKEIPDIAAFAKEQGDKVRVIGVALDWDETGKREIDEPKVKSFAKKVGITYPLVLGTDASEKTFGRVKGMPTTLVYDPTGKLVLQKTGSVTKDMLTRVINGEKVS